MLPRMPAEDPGCTCHDEQEYFNRMTFVCRCCGDCCGTMGEIISIREQIGPGEFRIGYPDGEERIVTVDPDKQDLFCKAGLGERKTIACPFLRRVSPEKQICTVHSGRPELCRSYLCARILVLDKRGRKAGRVLSGTRVFISEDESLQTLWSATLRNSQIRDEEEWEKAVEAVFLQAGFRVFH